MSLRISEETPIAATAGWEDIVLEMDVYTDVEGYLPDCSGSSWPFSPDFLKTIQGELKPDTCYHVKVTSGIGIPTNCTIQTAKEYARELHNWERAQALKRRQRQQVKIHRRQKRATFRRRKRGLA